MSSHRPKPVPSSPTPGASMAPALEASIESELSAVLEELARSGQIPAFGPPAGAAPDSPEAIGALPGLNVLAGLLAGPLARRLEVLLISKMEGMVAEFAVAKLAQVFPGVDPAAVRASVHSFFEQLRQSFAPGGDSTSPAPGPVEVAGAPLPA